MDLARQLKHEGWPVPGFLLFPGDPRHVRPHVALSVLGNMLEAGGVKVEPYVYYPVEDPRHVPAYVTALERQKKLWALQHLHPHPKSQRWTNFKRIANTIWTPFQYLIGAAVSLSAIIIIFHGISVGDVALNAPPAVAAVVFVILLILIAYAEGYHVTVITLEKANAEVFKESHPRAYGVHKLTNANVECFVVGRQVLLTLIVFIVATVTTFKEKDHVDDWWFFPGPMIKIFTQLGVGGSLIVLAFGQLLPQLIATAYPIHHINLPGGYAYSWLMLFVDKIGVANVGFWGAHLWRQWAGIMVNEEFGVGGEIVFGVDGTDGTAKATPTDASNKDVVTTAHRNQNEVNVGAQIGGEASGEIAKRVRKDPIEIAKLVFSSCLMLGTFAMAMRMMILQQSALSAPWPVLILIHIVLLICMTYLEGMNLCVLALEKVPNEQIALINPGAVEAHKLISGANGDKVRRFLLGRQFCVVWMDFLISKLGGLWSVAITVFLAQVMSQVIAATNPAYWMALPGARFMLMLSLSIEKLGVCHFGWFLGNVSQWLLEKIGVLRPEPFSVGKKVKIQGSHLSSSGSGGESGDELI
jgi:hypothetical protein